MEKILSIIVPTYNMEKYLHNCLDSLLLSEKQMQDYEVWIINDGSKDSSSEIAHSYELRYPDTFRVVDKNNGNYGSCINCGLKSASGEYIKVLDADDTFDNLHYSSYLNFLKDTEVDLVVTDYNIVNEDGKVLKKITFPLNKGEVCQMSPQILENYFLTLDYQMHSVTYNRRIFSTLNYNQTEGVSYTDQEWMFVPMTQVNTFVYFDGSLYQYLLGRVGQTMSPELQKKHINDVEIGTLKMLNDYEKYQNSIYTKYLQKRLCYRFKELYQYYIMDNSVVSRQHIEEWNNRIKKHSTLYQRSNQIVLNRYFPYKFIKHYRTSHHIIPLLMVKLYYDLSLLVYSFNHK